MDDHLYCYDEIEGFAIAKLVADLLWVGDGKYRYDGCDCKTSGKG